LGFSFGFLRLRHSESFMIYLLRIQLDKKTPLQLLDALSSDLKTTNQ